MREADTETASSHITWCRNARGQRKSRGVRFAQSLLASSFCAGLLFGVMSDGAPGAESPAPDTGGTQKVSSRNVFETPAYALQQMDLTRPVIDLVRGGRYAEAEGALRQLIGQFPDWAPHHYNLATVLARQNKREQAVESLAASVNLGFANKAAMERDPEFRALRDLPSFRRLLADFDRMRREAATRLRQPAAPKLVVADRAVVDRTNTVLEPRSNTLLSAFTFSKSPASPQVHGGADRVSRLLNRRHAGGRAAGNHGDLYDNRDGGHSVLSKKVLPQMTHIEYGAEAQAAGVHYGIGTPFLFNAITIGNSSTAVSAGPLWRSQARLILTTPRLIANAYLQYTNDHVYVFPEHRDHDPEQGDVFPANTPYMIVSQGSSGSDGVFLHAVGAILAAFQPEVKAFLRSKHLVMPTVQMILRSGMRSVRTHQDYLSAKAHPSVFDGKGIDLWRMINRAQNMRAEQIPPRVQIAVVEESTPRLGIDMFGPAGMDEKLFDTPGAVARIVRSTAHEKRMVLSTAGTADPNGHPLTFTWKVLRGDADRITISPRDDAASQVEIRVPWHRPRPVPHNPQLTTDRVDIAVFAHNGHHHSAPAFVSFYFPPNQARTYDEAGRIVEIDYDSEELQKRYADPVLFARRSWRDRYRHTEAGEITGWDRTSGGVTQRFTRHGARVVETDTNGRPTRAEVICYEVRRNDGDPPRIVEVPTGRILTYRYRGPSDLVGASSAAAEAGCPR